MVSNPKSEGRRPKEIRTPSSDSRWAREDAGSVGSGFWEWDGRGEGDYGLALHEEPQPDGRPIRDLLERTAQFGEAVVRLSKRIPKGLDHPENNRLVDQLVGAATSVGANYCEADDSVSGKDFKHKIGLCRKESKETMFFLRMIAASEVTLANDARRLWREARELNLIFGAIWRKQP